LKSRRRSHCGLAAAAGRAALAAGALTPVPGGFAFESAKIGSGNSRKPGQWRWQINCASVCAARRVKAGTFGGGRRGSEEENAQGEQS